MRQLPPLRAIRIFEVCAQALNFSVAARDLCLTHGAVSHQIKQLEEWLGLALFTRHANGVTLTHPGQILQRTAIQSLGQLEETCAQLRQNTDRQTVILAAPGSFMALWLIRRLEHFERSLPHLRLQLQTQGDYSDLAAGRIDMLVMSASPPWPKNVSATRLFEDRAGPVCAPEWEPLPRSPEELLRLPLLYTLSRRDAWTEWVQLQGLDAASLQLSRAFDNLQLMLEAAVSRLGIAIAPERLAERELRQGRLIAPLGFAQGNSQFSLCVAISRAEDPSLRTICEWMQDQATIPDMNSATSGASS